MTDERAGVAARNPGLAIDIALVLVIALAATIIEGLIVFAFRQTSKRR
jgi:hypothetical protein